MEANAQIKEQVQTIDQAYEELGRNKDRLEETISRMSQEATAREVELQETRKVAKKYQEVVEKAQETLTLTARERDEALAEKVGCLVVSSL